MIRDISVMLETVKVDFSNFRLMKASVYSLLQGYRGFKAESTFHASFRLDNIDKPWLNGHSGVQEKVEK